MKRSILFCGRYLGGHGDTSKYVTVTSRRLGTSGRDVRVTQSWANPPHDSSNEPIDATKLVEDLLSNTRQLMDGSKSHVIAYSGGIDSSVVATLVHLAAESDESVTAVLGLSPALPSEQAALAEQVAGKMGFPLEQIPTTEGNDETYIANAGQACLACKTHLYTCLESVAHHVGSSCRLYNGTNADDLLDPTRLGLIAADQFQVQSPLRYTTKEQVRQVGRHLGLPNWNFAASPCLRSRLAVGVAAIPQHLQRIEQAERHVRQSLELDPTCNLRVRLLSRNRAMIELDDDVVAMAQTRLGEWEAYFFDLEFSSVQVRPFKSGSVAKVVPRVADSQQVSAFQ